MSKKHILEEELEKLKQENKKLRQVLNIAKSWMEKEVKQNVLRIAKSKLSRLSSETRDSFFGDNIEDVITVKIFDFFGEIMLLNVPADVIDSIISAEINYYHLKENPISDGISVISSYHKSLDSLVEQFIIKGFRKFCKKNGYDILRRNETIEKMLNSVVNKGYILSIGRLFHIIQLIKKDLDYYDYVKAFKKYLDKYTHIKDILLSDNFYTKLESIINTNILGSKRHTGKIDYVETREARNIIIGDFNDKDCLMYKLIEIQDVNL